MFKNLSMGMRLGFGFGSVIVMLIIVATVGLRSMKYTDEQLDDIVHDNMVRMKLTSTLSEAVYIIGSDIRMLVLQNTAAEMNVEMEKIKEERKKYDATLEEFNKKELSNEEKKLLEAIKNSALATRPINNKAIEFAFANKDEEARHILSKESSPLMKKWQDDLDAMTAYQEKINKEQTEEAGNKAAAAEKVMMTLTLIASVMGIAIAVMVIKNVRAEQHRTVLAMTEAAKQANMVEKSPINTMMATPEGIFTYMNENSFATLTRLQQYLPSNPREFIGKSIDIIHKNPELQKRIIRDPKNLPHKALINVGPEKLSAVITAIMDDHGNYLGPMVNWEIVTDKVNLIRDLTSASENLATAASNVLGISTSLSAAAEETSAQANTASVASEEVNAGVQTVASNMEEMVAAIKEITKTTNEAAGMTNESMRLAKNTNNIINKLGESSMDIGNVIKVISSIAQQTNLLALNATIEAARAGEAGKGFAVVANEVKELANQTAKATNEITKKIETIQSDSQNAVNAIAEITTAIEKVNGYTGNIAASVEEQAATTNEVTRIITESAEGVKQINENISQVSQAAANTGKDAGSAQLAARGVGETAEQLKKLVSGLKV